MGAATVLLIDQHDPDTMQLRETFEGAGLEVVHVDESARALAYVQRLSPSLVVLADSIAGMSGYMICGQLKRHPTLGRIPVVMTSASPDAAQTFARHAASPTRADAYLLKPFDPGQLLEIARRYELVTEDAGGLDLGDVLDDFAIDDVPDSLEGLSIDEVSDSLDGLGAGMLEDLDASLPGARGSASPDPEEIAIRDALGAGLGELSVSDALDADLGEISVSDDLGVELGELSVSDALDADLGELSVSDALDADLGEISVSDDLGAGLGADLGELSVSDADQGSGGGAFSDDHDLTDDMDDLDEAIAGAGDALDALSIEDDVLGSITNAGERSAEAAPSGMMRARASRPSSSPGSKAIGRLTLTRAPAPGGVSAGGGNADVERLKRLLEKRNAAVRALERELQGLRQEVADTGLDELRAQLRERDRELEALRDVEATLQQTIRRLQEECEALRDVEINQQQSIEQLRELNDELRGANEGLRDQVSQAEHAGSEQLSARVKELEDELHATQARLEFTRAEKAQDRDSLRRLRYVVSASHQVHAATRDALSRVREALSQQLDELDTLIEAEDPTEHAP